MKVNFYLPSYSSFNLNKIFVLNQDIPYFFVTLVGFEHALYG